jgi:hypothetical protein
VSILIVFSLELGYHIHVLTGSNIKIILAITIPR